MSVRDILNSLLEVKTTVTNKHEYERRCTMGRHAFWPIYVCCICLSVMLPSPVTERVQLITLKHLKLI